MSLFAWGSNKYGEICCPDEASSWSPRHVELPEGQIAISIASGEGHSVVATESGDVFSFGRGREGQLGLGIEKKNLSTPTLIKELQHESVIKVAAGGISSYAITANGRVYHW
jgi:alpha-tubulin suppressor-like RCC1 family protein